MERTDVLSVVPVQLSRSQPVSVLSHKQVEGFKATAYQVRKEANFHGKRKYFIKLQQQQQKDLVVFISK